MMDDKGRRVKEAGPSTPVEILGLSDVPNAGESWWRWRMRKRQELCGNLSSVRAVSGCWKRQSQECLWMICFSQIQAGNLKELNLIVKADVQGSVEAVKAEPCEAVQ